MYGWLLCCPLETTTTLLIGYTPKKKFKKTFLKALVSVLLEVVTVVTQYYTKTDSNANRYVNLISLDVSDPANIVKKEEFNITGVYMSSRKADGSILLLT